MKSISSISEKTIVQKHFKLSMAEKGVKLLLKVQTQRFFFQSTRKVSKVSLKATEVAFKQFHHANMHKKCYINNIGTVNHII